MESFNQTILNFLKRRDEEVLLEETKLYIKKVYEYFMVEIGTQFEIIDKMFRKRLFNTILLSICTRIVPNNRETTPSFIHKIQQTCPFNLSSDFLFATERCMDRGISWFRSTSEELLQKGVFTIREGDLQESKKDDEVSRCFTERLEEQQMLIERLGGASHKLFYKISRQFDEHDDGFTALSKTKKGRGYGFGRPDGSWENFLGLRTIQKSTCDEKEPKYLVERIHGSEDSPNRRLHRLDTGGRSLRIPGPFPGTIKPEIWNNHFSMDLSDHNDKLTPTEVVSDDSDGNMESSGEEDDKDMDSKRMEPNDN